MLPGLGVGALGEVMQLRFSGESDDEANLETVGGRLQFGVQGRLEERRVDVREVRLDLFQERPVLDNPGVLFLRAMREMEFPWACGESAETGGKLARAMEEKRPTGTKDSERSAGKRRVHHL